MKLPLRLLLLATLLAPLTSRAEDLPTGMANEIEAGLSHDKLDNGYANWDSIYLDVSHRIGERHSVYGELRETERFNLRDREISAGYCHPLSETWTGLIEASASPDHNILAKNSLFAQLQKALDSGWGVHGGLRHSQYDTGSTDLMILTGERYWGNYRGAYTFYLGKPQDAGAASSHKGQFSYYYDERNYLAFGISAGRQVESLGSGLGVLTTEVINASFSGRHWLDSGWGISYEAIIERQGDLYTRKGIRFGLRHAF
jgi:YaiO family outer membrane protein